MTDKYFNSLINTLNKKQRKEHIFIRELTNNVDLAKIYTDTPKMSDSLGSSNLLPHVFFCIKNENKQYVGIVLDMSTDLHWFVKKAHRKKGYLTKALKNCILPFLFQQNRDEQIVTINKHVIGEENFIASKNVAIKSGFVFESEENGKAEYFLKSEDSSNNIGLIKGINKELSKEELKDITKKVNYHINKLIRLQTDLDMRYGLESEILFEFREQLANLRYFSMQIEDIWYENKEK